MNDFSSDYYTTTAQIIGLLFVVIAIELRFWAEPAPDEGNEESWSGIALSTLAPLPLLITTGLGIGAALRSLQDGTATGVADTLIVGTLAVQGFTILALPPVSRLLNLARTSRRAAGGAAGTLMAAVTLAGLAMPIYALWHAVF